MNIWFVWRVVFVFIFFVSFFDALSGAFTAQDLLVWIGVVSLWLYVGLMIDGYKSRKKGWEKSNRWE